MSRAVSAAGMGSALDAGDTPTCGPIDMRIGKCGTWFYHGSPIPRKEMVCLFASMLRRHSDGTYWLLNPPLESCQITVEDVPFLAVELFVAGSGREAVFSFRTNVDEIVTLDADHPLRIVEAAGRGGTPTPYVLVRDGLEARLTRPVYYELVAHCFEEKVGDVPQYGVWSKGRFFPLGAVD